MKRWFLGLAALALLFSPTLANETISGTAQVINATTMTVDRKTVQLFAIRSPKAGTICTWKSKRMMDCSKLAAAGLKDITIGSTVTCTEQINKTYVCNADGFDLAFGLIHAGWAVPTKQAPKNYFKKSDNARNNKRGLWHAINAHGQPIASLIR